MTDSAVDTTTHDLLLSVGYYIQGGIAAAYSLLVGLYFCFLGFALSNSPNGGNPPPNMARFFAVLFGAVVLLGAGYAILQFLAAYWITRHRARVYLFVVAALNCIGIPYGTVLGIFTFMVLQRPAAKQLFIASAVRGELSPVQSPFAVNPDVSNH